jgi:hypothetical protein
LESESASPDRLPARSQLNREPQGCHPTEPDVAAAANRSARSMSGDGLAIRRMDGAT